MKLRPMRPLGVTYMRAHPNFTQAMSVCQKMGLHHLMGIKCNYNPYLVEQFFSTLSFEGDCRITMHWMTSTTYCTSDFYNFGAILGYDFEGPTPVGHRIHNSERPDKDKLEDLYLPGMAHVARNKHLHPLYAQLILIFHDNIAPSGGNNDAIITSLVDLLHFAHEVSLDERVGMHYKIDVMDFIYTRRCMRPWLQEHISPMLHTL